MSLDLREVGEGLPGDRLDSVGDVCLVEASKRDGHPEERWFLNEQPSPSGKWRPVTYLLKLLYAASSDRG